VSQNCFCANLRSCFGLFSETGSRCRGLIPWTDGDAAHMGFFFFSGARSTLALGGKAGCRHLGGAKPGASKGTARHIPGRYSALLISSATSLFLWTVSSRNRPSLHCRKMRDVYLQQKDTTFCGLVRCWRAGVVSSSPPVEGGEDNDEGHESAKIWIHHL